MITWFEKHYKISWTITIIIAITIFYLSSKTFDGPPGGVSYFSIFYHFLAFFYLSFFLLISLIKGKINKNLLIIGLILAILYGISDEIHQYFVPGRASTISDVLINSAGILFAGTLYSIRFKNNHHPRTNINSENNYQSIINNQNLQYQQLQ